MNIFDPNKPLNFHFSQLSKTPIYQGEKKIGFFKDFFVNYEEAFPSVLAIQFKLNRQSRYFKWEDIELFSTKKIIVSQSAHFGTNENFPRVYQENIVTGLLANQFKGEAVEYPPLSKVILDKQVVDTSGKKVVRVNDIELIRAGDNLKVTHALVGLRSLLRRLGYLNFIDFFAKIFIKNSAHPFYKESIINWKFIHAIPTQQMHQSVKVSLTNEDIKKLHPADLADILEELDSNSRKIIFNELDTELAAETLSEVEQNIQISLIRDEPAKDVAKIIEKMGTDEAADILSEVEEVEAAKIIENIEDSETKTEIQELLVFEEDSAGGLMSTEVFEITPNLTKNDILQIIKNEHEEIESIYDIFIVNKDSELIGHCSLSKLLTAKTTLKLVN